MLRAERGDGREARPHPVGVEVAQVERDLAAQLGGPPGDGARHHVARAELGHGVHVGHEPPPAGVAQDRALAAHGLAHQGQRPVAQGERRGVELHQLEVGQRGAGPGREGRPVGRRPGGVGRARVEPAHAARGQRDGARGALAHAPVRADGAQPGGAPVADEDLGGPLALGELDARVGAQRGRQRRHDVGPGRVAAGVHDAGRRVGALAREAQPAAAAVEDDPAREQLGHLRRPLPADRRRRLGVAQPRAGLQGVAQVGPTESPRSTAAAMPPWARRVLPSPSAPSVMTTTGPDSAAPSAASAPAMPLPTTMTGSCGWGRATFTSP